MDLRTYYHDVHVRRRIVEFLGEEAATCAFLHRCDGPHRRTFAPRASDGIDEFLEHGWEIARSLWDHEALIAHLDVEYVNHDFPGEAIHDPHRAFALQQPVVDAIEEVLADLGIDALHVLTGRGHHFVWRIPFDSAAASALVAIGRLPAHLSTSHDQGGSPEDFDVPIESRRGHAGLALVLERFAHRVQELAAPRCEIPVTFTDVRVGPGRRGRESVSIDLSEYGDPVHTRMIRAPFSVYLKAHLDSSMFPPERRHELPTLFSVPQHEIGTHDGIELMRDPSAVRDLARRASARIPDGARGTARLIDDYRHSRLARFHDWYHDRPTDPPDRWSRTYDRLPLAELPPCVADSIRRPNDVLLQPGGIRRLAATLWADGWHPRHVSGLLRSKFERDHDWGARFLHYDAATRADFYVRLFTGALAVGRDELVDFNCVSEKEKGTCTRPDASCDLAPWRERALERTWP